ncbi:MAG: phospholipase C, phosphocholine-specific [Nevskiales bacterium]|nr:phospholipase C, phosphocholine-specific [Nevskiales bacterium]
MSLDRRGFLRLAGSLTAGAMLPQCIRDALAIPAHHRSGTLEDVEHIVVLMQENRGFDHYFGTLHGVRGFGDRFTVPQSGGRSVWEQRDLQGRVILPYHLDSRSGNAQRVSGTPHSWDNATPAWNKGRFGHWPTFKEPQSMGYYREEELPLQFALANAFTLCDAYHCAFQGNTNPNRLFMFTGTNDPFGTGGGPPLYNDNDDMGPPEDGFTWTTYPERLEAAGVSWKVYQDMDDNFTDNSLEGFRPYREAYYTDNASPLMKGVSTTMPAGTFDALRDDVLAGTLPQVSWIVGPARYSEHTGPSSPVQGGWFIQEVIKALIADPAVWSKTVLLVMFDENDGFFDHVPPPCAPSRRLDGSLAGASTVDDRAERYEGLEFHQGVFGPGPRVPMYVISPWSRGGWVNSQVFDHTSIIRFIEARFGVYEPNISPWRRAVCGDLTSCFNFAAPNDEAFPELPRFSREHADQIRSEQERLEQIPAPLDEAGTRPLQDPGARPSRALPYELHVGARVDRAAVALDFDNTGTQAAVFHVYDRLNLSAVPRRYTVESGKRLSDTWATTLRGGDYDLWVLGPNGFHRHFAGNTLAPAAGTPEIMVCYDVANGDVLLKVRNDTGAACVVELEANAYRDDGPWRLDLAAGAQLEQAWILADSGAWYDFSVRIEGDARYLRRFAGRVETGRHSISDPAMGLGD